MALVCCSKCGTENGEICANCGRGKHLLFNHKTKRYMGQKDNPCYRMLQRREKVRRCDVHADPVAECVTDPYTRALERRVRLLLKEHERLDAENRQLRDDKRDLAERLLAHVPYERRTGGAHTADTLELIAKELTT